MCEIHDNMTEGPEGATEGLLSNFANLGSLNGKLDESSEHTEDCATYDDAVEDDDGIVRTEGHAGEEGIEGRAEYILRVSYVAAADATCASSNSTARGEKAPDVGRTHLCLRLGQVGVANKGAASGRPEEPPSHARRNGKTYGCLMLHHVARCEYSRLAAKLHGAQVVVDEDQAVFGVRGYKPR